MKNKCEMCVPESSISCVNQTSRASQSPHFKQQNQRGKKIVKKNYILCRILNF